MILLFARAFVRDDRGQAFVESAIFLPLLMVALFSIIFFDRIGVLSERSQTAVRYGDLVSFRGGQSYAVSTIQLVLQQAVYGNSTQQLLDLCLASPNAAQAPVSITVPQPSTPPTTAPNINGDIRAALYQAQTTGTATAPPSAKPFFQADQISQPNCSAGTIDLNGAAPSGGTNQYAVGDMPLSVQSFSITAQVAPPAWVAPIYSTTSCTAISGAWGNQCAATGASMAFVNVATPNTLLACIPGMSVVLTIMNPNAQKLNCN